MNPVLEFSTQTFLQTESFSLQISQSVSRLGAKPQSERERTTTAAAAAKHNRHIVLGLSPVSKVGEKQSLDVKLFNVSSVAFNHFSFF